MGWHYFYVYYDGEAYHHDSHRLSYRDPLQKQKFIKLKHGIHIKKLRGKIMIALGLDHDLHIISIRYRAPRQLVKTKVFYNSIHLLCDNDVDMMWVVIKQTPQLIAFDLYVKARICVKTQELVWTPK